MKVVHHCVLHTNCPVNGDKDTYEVTIWVRNRTIKCEDILEAIGEMTLEPTFQEVLTQAIADKLGCRVRTVGTHVQGAVKTTVVCRPKKKLRLMNDDFWTIHHEVQNALCAEGEAEVNGQFIRPTYDGYTITGHDFYYSVEEAVRAALEEKHETTH